jgi:hypothetical protein
MSDQFISASEGYNYTLSDYLYREKGISSPSKLIPFYIQMVDRKGEIQNIERDDGVTVSGLTLFINPLSVSFNMSKMISRQQTMTGWVEEHWGEEMDAISLQGNTAAFIMGPNGTGARVRDVTSSKLYGGANTVATSDAQMRSAFNATLGLEDIGSNTTESLDAGLTTKRRKQTVGYLQFKQIIKIMENNGCTFDTLGFVKERRFVQLSYDYASYRGYIESIDTVEDSITPFRFTYTIVFKSERTVYTLMQ